jgi:3-deoxy-D-manno-octulosonic-acid transferase
MNTILILLYNFVWTVVYVFTLPYSIYKRFRTTEEWRERVGRYPFDYSKEEKSIWIHGASVGEITAAGKLALRIKDTFPKRRVIVSSMTVSGKAKARKIMNEINGCVILPFDFLPFVKRAVRRINPKSLILIETEIWPSLIFHCRRRGIKILLANARLSDRSFGRYLRIRWLSRSLFNKIDYIFAQSRRDADKFVRLGVKKSRVEMAGSLKVDNSKPVPLTRDQVFIPSNKSVIVAGSVRKGEIEIIIKVFKTVRDELENSYLIIAPRHLNRVGEIEGILNRENISYMKRTSKKSFDGEDVLILDTIGELRSFYSIADIAFVGGTLLPYGGHNLLEPAFFGVPILFGPHTENTRESAHDLIQLECAIMVKNEKDFRRDIYYLLQHPLEREKMGKNSKEYIRKKRGIVDYYIESLRKEDFF